MTMIILGTVYFLAHAFQYLFMRFRIPDVLLFMLIGLIGGSFTGFITPDSFGKTGATLSTIALVLILFDSGVTLNLRDLRSAWKETLGLTVLTALATGVIFYFIGLSLGLNSTAALILGAVLSGTSSAVVIPMLGSLKIKSTNATASTMESTITDVLCIVITASLMESYQSGILSFGKISLSILISFSGALVLGFGCGLLWHFLALMTRQFPNTNLATLAFGLIVFGFAEAIGISGGITIMAFGFCLANSGWFLKTFFPKKIVFEAQEEDVRYQSGPTAIEKTIYSELIFILKTFFFIYLGVSILLKDTTIVFAALMGTLLTFMVRMIVVRLVVSRQEPLRDRTYLSLLVPKGLAAAVLASLPAQQGIEGGELIQLTVYSVVFLSILICALATPFAEQKTISTFFASVLGDQKK